MTTPPPSDWLGTLQRVAGRLLVVALMLYVAARLLASVWPVLLVIGVVVFVGFGAWTFYQFRKSRW